MYCEYTLQNIIINGQPQRLSPLAHSNMRCDSLFSCENMRGRSEEFSPPYRKYMVNKSNSIITNSQNQDPVLNECAARLGVSLRQTEDQLTRDMLASTAGFINCTGGVNGDNPTEITRSDVDTVVRSLLNNNAYTIMDKLVVHLKSSLIDLEALWGNKGQAQAA